MIFKTKRWVIEFEWSWPWCHMAQRWILALLLALLLLSGCAEYAMHRALVANYKEHHPNP